MEYSTSCLHTMTERFLALIVIWVAIDILQQSAHYMHAHTHTHTHTHIIDSYTKHMYVFFPIGRKLNVVQEDEPDIN